MGLDRLDSRSVEHHGGVKGGSAAAQRVPLTPPWGSNTTGQAIKAANLSKNVSGMSPNTCQICLRAIQLSRPSTPCLPNLGKEDVDARDKRGHDGGGVISIALERTPVAI
jgi:hypothetical protein